MTEKWVKPWAGGILLSSMKSSWGLLISAVLQGLIVKPELFNISISDWGDGAHWTQQVCRCCRTGRRGWSWSTHGSATVLSILRFFIAFGEAEKWESHEIQQMEMLSPDRRKRQTDSSQWCPGKGQEEMGMNWNTGGFIITLYCEGDWILQGVVESPSLEMLKLSRTWPWGTCPTWPCFEQRVGLNNLQGSLPTPAILWLLWASKDLFPKDPACLGLFPVLLVIHKHSLRSSLLWL